MWGEPDRQLYICYMLLCLFYACPKISNCLSQHHSHSCFLSQQHALLLSHVPCFVSASHCSCSLMCLALSQHHAALARLSCALLCLSITLLLLHLMCLALSQHHAVHVPCLVSAFHTALCSALPCSGYSIVSIAQLHTHVKQSVNGCEILDCPMN